MPRQVATSERGNAASYHPAGASVSSCAPVTSLHGTDQMITPPRVKICGLQSTAAAIAATQAGADLLGFNFAPVSKRRIDPAVAGDAITASRQVAPATVATPATVGIFVNQALHQVLAVAVRCELDYIQLSGDEDVAYCQELAAQGGRPLIKAVRLGRPQEAPRVEAYLRSGAIAVLLADAAVAGSWGGSGRTWDWQAAAGLATRYPVLLAGGLTPGNVAAAVATVRPWGVDVASGVETYGATDPGEVLAFVQNAKASATSQPPAASSQQPGRREGEDQ